MGFIKQLIAKHKNKVIERENFLSNCINEITIKLNSLENIFQNKDSFIDPEEENIWSNSVKDLTKNFDKIKGFKFKRLKNYKEFVNLRNSFINQRYGIHNRICNFNDELAEKKIEEAYSIIGNVEGRKLDKQQMKCIVIEAHNQLIIAGAGTGKTTTVVGKIKYLLKTNKYEPKDILVLSFTNASASEMKERICKETGLNIAASTFHKLGLNIITKVNGITPKISKISLSKFIKEKLELYMQNKKYLAKLTSYLLYNNVVSKSEFDFETQDEYKEYLKLNPPVTLKNEQVKSYGEMTIANFLFQNGINYIYEAPYKIDTRTEEYEQYYPDFYLPDYDIYIEYFGINRKGEVPDYFTGKDNMTASETYKTSMEWKRNLHKQNRTTLIESFAYEHFENILLDNLETNLKNKNVNFNSLSEKDLMSELLKNQKGILEGVINLFQTVINLIKSNNYSLDDLHNVIEHNPNAKTNNAILDLVTPIYNDYCKCLQQNDEIDFNDMINLATFYVNNGKFNSPYKYVIVDEYQDISKARFNLLESLRKINNYDLFCVGDDWQSIYRFAGSDINYILDFEKYWGKTQINKIETTYRFSQELIDVTSNFIMKNPAQIRKNIKGKRENTGIAIGNINAYTEKKATDFILQKLDKLPKDSSVFFIGRYSFDVDMLQENKSLTCSYNNVSGVIDVKYNKRPDLKMSFITAHKSKGLEADYIFILNNKNSKTGFPSQIQNAPIIDLLLDAREVYPHAEERRLYYVALTRAKIKAFFITIDKQESVFALELIQAYGKKLNHEILFCPLCGGRLVERHGKYGKFYGCSNYSINNCKYKRKIDD